MDELETLGGMSSSSASAPAAVEQQKMLPQEEVNRIVAREKARAAESARREVEERYQRDLEALNAQRMAQEQRNAEVSREVDANTIYQQVQERFNREMQERQLRTQMENVANSYLQKVEEAKKNYDDFDEVTKTFDPTKFPQLTYMLSGIQNAGDVLYELQKNPEKLGTIDHLASKSPDHAQILLLKLSQSIANNRQAQADAQTQQVSEPLDRLQPSRVSGSNGKMTISDLRNQPWLRG
jgi:hypothetical protein